MFAQTEANVLFVDLFFDGEKCFLMSIFKNVTLSIYSVSWASKENQDSVYASSQKI